MVYVESAYEKPATTVEEQVHLLTTRGFDVGDPAEAQEILGRIGFFRLSGYWYTFRRDLFDESGAFIGKRSDVRAGTPLRAVHGLYVFDAQLRSCLLEAIAEIEVGFRAQIGATLARRGVFAHRDPGALSSSFTAPAPDGAGGGSSAYAAWVEECSRQEARSKEPFAEHLRRKYGPNFPVWAAVEVMTFGALENLLTGMRQDDRQLLASELDLHLKDGRGDSALLSSILGNLRLLRNSCAHHVRVWNKTFPNVASMKQVPDLNHIHAETPKVYGTIVILAFLLARIAPTSTWRDRVRLLVESRSREVGFGLVQLGFPDGWEREAIWQPGYERDPLNQRRALLAGSLETVSAVEARVLLSSERSGNPRSLLRYLVDRRALSYVTVGEAKRYPIFQFDTSASFVSTAVADVNAEILDIVSSVAATEEEARVLAFEWWMTQSGKGVDPPTVLVPAGSMSREEAVQDFRAFVAEAGLLPVRHVRSRAAGRSPLGSRRLPQVWHRS